MITIFTCPKPGDGHVGMIQRNALRALVALGHDAEILVVGDDEGTPQIAAEFGLRHVDSIEVNEHGTPLLSSLFERAEREARHDVLAYVNADILLGPEFLGAVRACSREPQFLLVGERINLDVVQALNFDAANSRDRWFEEAIASGVPAGDDAIDYFVFHKGFWTEMPPFALGRTAWDNWMLYDARKRGAKLINGSGNITAIHQNHDYAHTREAKKGSMWKGEEASRNRDLAGECFFDLVDSNYVLKGDRIVRATGDAFVRRRMDRLEEYHPLIWRMLMSWKLRYGFCRFRSRL